MRHGVTRLLWNMCGMGLCWQSQTATLVLPTTERAPIMQNTILTPGTVVTYHGSMSQFHGRLMAVVRGEDHYLLRFLVSHEGETYLSRVHPSSFTVRPEFGLSDPYHHPGS